MVDAVERERVVDELLARCVGAVAGIEGGSARVVARGAVARGGDEARNSGKRISIVSSTPSGLDASSSRPRPVIPSRSGSTLRAPAASRALAARCRRPMFSSSRKDGSPASARSPDSHATASRTFAGPASAARSMPSMRSCSWRRMGSSSLIPATSCARPDARHLWPDPSYLPIGLLAYMRLGRPEAMTGCGRAIVHYCAVQHPASDPAAIRASPADQAMAGGLHGRAGRAEGRTGDD